MGKKHILHDHLSLPLTIIASHRDFQQTKKTRLKYFGEETEILFQNKKHVKTKEKEIRRSSGWVLVVGCVALCFLS
jgi:hypothetical protein